MLLNGRLELHGVDGERLARKALDDALRTRGAFLRPVEYEDALSFLVTAFWETSTKWDPERGGNFATHAYRLLRLRLVDWYRSELGRTKWQWSDSSYERERPTLLSLEHETGIGGPGKHDTGNAERIPGELARAYAERSSDPANDRDPDLDGLLTGGGRQRARDLDELGLEPNARAAA